jgi:sulfate adenylyltransferase (ADP) / ATP adenylyltransferase
MASRLPAPAPGSASPGPSSQDQAPLLDPRELWAKTVAATAHANACGAIRPIAATYSVIEEAGIPFVVWSPAPRSPAKQASAKEKPTYADDSPNPFLPYAPEMFVADLTPTHVCLLNKYNIFAHHLLIVTRAFEHQEDWLTAADFTAMWLCMAAFPGLAFYNAGQVAGASQRHKHLQYVPLPLTPGAPDLPTAATLARAEYTGPIGHIAALPFRHALARLDPAWAATPVAAGAATVAIYLALLEAVGIPYQAGRQGAPYNLLATPAWMLLVPRSRESYQGISVNALGYAGSLLARGAPQAEVLRREGPLAVLRQVGLPALEG